MDDELLLPLLHLLPDDSGACTGNGTLRDHEDDGDRGWTEEAAGAVGTAVSVSDCDMGPAVPVHGTQVALNLLATRSHAALLLSHLMALAPVRPDDDKAGALCIAADVAAVGAGYRKKMMQEWRRQRSAAGPELLQRCYSL